MGFESGLAQQASTFVESLHIKPAPAVEKTVDETGQEMKLPEQGDIVTISKEARALAAPENSGDSGKSSGGEDDQNQTVKMLQERIEKLEEEIKEIEDGDLPQKEKLQKVQGKQAQLMQLRDQLLSAQQEELKLDGMSNGGGTRANGAGNNVADF